MGRDPFPSAAERIKASIKDAMGKLTGSTGAKPEGHAEEAETKASNSAASAEGEPENVTRK